MGNRLAHQNWSGKISSCSCYENIRISSCLTTLSKQRNWNSSSCKISGLLDKRLRFNQHVIEIARRAIQRLLAVYPMLRSPSLLIKTKLYLYEMIIHPILLYAAPVFCHVSCSKYIFKEASNRTKSCSQNHHRILKKHKNYATRQRYRVAINSGSVKSTSRNFWLRLCNSNIPALTSIGTLEAHRNVHKMPRPPDNI